MAGVKISITPQTVRPGEKFLVKIKDENGGTKHLGDVRYGGEAFLWFDLPDGVESQAEVLMPESMVSKFPEDQTLIEVEFVVALDVPLPRPSWAATASVTLKDYLPAKPTVSAEASPVSSLPAPFSDVFILRKSIFRLDITAIPAAGTSISKKEVTFMNRTWTLYGADNEIEHDIWYAGKLDYSVKAIDKRGFSSTFSSSVDVIPYYEPSVTTYNGKLSVARCSDDGTPNPSGKSMKIIAGRRYSTVPIAGKQANFCSLRYRIQPNGKPYSEWETLIPPEDTTTEGLEKVLQVGLLETESDYRVQIEATDTIGESYIHTARIPADFVPLHLGEGGKNIGIGMYCDYKKSLAADFGWKAFFHAGIGKDVIFQAKKKGDPKWTEGPIATAIPNANADLLAIGTVFLAIVEQKGNRTPILLVKDYTTIDGSYSQNITGSGRYGGESSLKYTILIDGGDYRLLLPKQGGTNPEGTSIAALFMLF